MLLKRIREKIDKIESKVISISILLTGISIIGKLFGLFKIHLMARIFATSKVLDIFYASFALPDLIFTLLVIGTVNAALVPIFIKIRKESDAKTLHQTINTTIFLIFFMMLFLLGILYFTLPSITSLLFANPNVMRVFDVALDIKQGSESYYKTLFINLSRLMLISPLLLSVSSIFGAELQSKKRFISTALAPFMYNVGIVIGILFFVRFAPHFGIYSLAYSVIFGSFLHFFTQLVGVMSDPNLDLSWSFGINKYVKEIGKLSIPRIIGLGVEQIGILFNTFLGFTMGSGALAVFKFASNIHLLPVDIISGSFLQLIFPRLSEHAHANDKYSKLNKLYWRTTVFLFLIIIPIIALFTVLRLPLVRLLYGAGRFTWNATVVTSFTLVFLTPSILFQSIAALNIRTFYALNNTKTPFIISVVGVILNILFSIAFTNFFSHYHAFVAILYNPAIWFENIPLMASWFVTKNGSFASVAGLSFGLSVGLFAEVLLSFLLLSKKTKLLEYIKPYNLPIKSITTILFSGVLTFIASYFTYRLCDSIFDTSRVVGVIQVLTVTGSVGILVYAATCYKVIKQYIDIRDLFQKMTGYVVRIKDSLN